MSDYFLTYLWTWMECFSAILLFDAFSARKMERFRHWTIVTSLAFLEATLLNFAAITMPNYSKIVIGLVLLFSLHRFLYTSNRMFSFYISVISYATICCVDNCWYTMLLLMSEAQDSVTPGEMVWQNLFIWKQSSKESWRNVYKANSLKKVNAIGWHTRYNENS